jgi:hypothetical protein
MTTLPVHAPLPRRDVVASAPARTGRSLLSYLLVPRPKDLVKAVVLPLAFAVGAVADGGVSGTQLVRAVLVWLALELLVYQARYQWNDARGFYADQAHPDAASRGRLPGPVEKARPHITASVLVAALRLALTAALALMVPALTGVLVAMTVGVFGVAFLYERLRSAATGRTAQVPVPLRPALIGLWTAVGMGYAVRGLTGLALAVDLGGRPGLVVVAVVAMWALGIVFVTCRWALEAMCFGAVREGRIVWEVRPDQAREHTLGLVRWLPEEVTPGETSSCAWRALQGRTPLTAPWNLALAVAGAATALAGRLLVGADSVPGGVLAVVAGAGLALVVAAVPGRRVVAAVASAVVLGALQVLSGTDRTAVAVVPWLVALALYGCFTRQCADEIGHPLRRFARA